MNPEFWSRKIGLLHDNYMKITPAFEDNDLDRVSFAIGFHFQCVMNYLKIVRLISGLIIRI